MADSPDEKRPSSLKKKLLIWVVLPLALILGALLLLDGSAQGRLNVAMREARAIGGPVTFEELMAARRVWPEEQNGANVILKLKDRLDELNKNQKQLKALPVWGDKRELPLGYRLPPERDGAAGDALTQLASELSQIDRLSQYQGGRFALTIAANPIDTQLPDLVRVRISAKLKAAQAQYRAMHGDMSHAVEDVAVILAHGQLLADEPMLISALVRVACDGLAVDTVQHITALAPLTPGQLVQLQGRLAAAANEDRLSWGFRGERATFIAFTDWLRKQGMMPWDCDDPSGSGTMSKLMARAPGIRGLMKRDEATGLRLHNRLAAAAGDRKKALEADRAVAAEREALPFYCMTTRTLMPSLKRVHELDGNLEAQIRSAVAGLAAERYRLDHGQFPERLDDLVPQYLPRVPLDPFNDEPLRLRNKDGMLMIYSVGADLNDDGGGLVGWQEKGPYPDWGFILLPPERRGLPASEPATEPAETEEERAARISQRDERIQRFRYGDQAK